MLVQAFVFLSCHLTYRSLQYATFTGTTDKWLSWLLCNLAMRSRNIVEHMHSTVLSRSQYREYCYTSTTLNRVNFKPLLERPTGGTQIWFGLGCASKPIPIFEGHFGCKKDPFLGIFLEKKANFSQFLRARMAFQIFGNLGKMDPCLGIFLQEIGPMFRDFLWKKRPIRAAHPRMS